MPKKTFKTKAERKQYLAKRRARAQARDAKNAGVQPQPASDVPDQDGDKKTGSSGSAPDAASASVAAGPAKPATRDTTDSPDAAEENAVASIAGPADQSTAEAVAGTRSGSQNTLRPDGQNSSRRTGQNLGRAARAAQTAPPMPPVAEGARFKFRHFMVVMSFLVLVVLPSAGTQWYLYERAADQYVSTVGFSVRKEEVGSAVEVLGSISNISSGSSSDTDILYEFIQSQEQVVQVNKRLDLRRIFSKPQNDPLFSLSQDSSLEDLVDYWNRMIRIFYNGSNGLIQIRVHAFAPEDAKAIAEAIFDESALMINKLSTIARADATRYASEELELAVERLKQARQAITKFRNETQIVDPKADLQGQMGLLNTLQQQLAEALIEQDLLLQTTQPNDPRNAQARRKVDVIRNRISSERDKFSSGENDETSAYSTLIARYEGLSVELEFAEQFYLSALQTYDAARSEAQRTSRYLAAYVEPTLAETAQYPKRVIIFALVTLFAFLIWSITVMVGYSVRSRR